LQQKEQNKILETSSLQLGHDALSDLQDGGVVGLPLGVRALFRDAVSTLLPVGGGAGAEGTAAAGVEGR